MQRYKREALLAQYPLVVVPFPFGGECVEMLVEAVRVKSCLPSIEAIPAKSRTMFFWFHIQASKTVLTGSAPEPRAIHEPQAPRGARGFPQGPSSLFDTSLAVQRRELFTASFRG